MLTNYLRKSLLKTSNRHFSSLIVAEQFEGKVSENVRSVVGAASKFGEDVHILLHGKDPESQLDRVYKIAGVSKVILAKHDNLENASSSDLANVSHKVLISGGYKRLLTPATNFGKDFIPRIAGKIDSQPITDVVKIESEHVFHRPVYAGNAISIVESTDATKLITVRPTNFDPVADGSDTAQSESVDVSDCIGDKFKAEWIQNIVAK
jgi:electron transfer flavoprotein alpha subunit